MKCKSTLVKCPAVQSCKQTFTELCEGDEGEMWEVARISIATLIKISCLAARFQVSQSKNHFLIFIVLWACFGKHFGFSYVKKQ